MNCTQVSKKRRNDSTKQKDKNIIDIDKSLCLKVYTKEKPLGTALIRPPYAGRPLFLPQQNLFFTASIPDIYAYQSTKEQALLR